MAAVCLWAVAAWVLAVPGPLDRHGTPKLPDFAQFHAYGTLTLAGHGATLFTDVTRWLDALGPAWAMSASRTYIPVYPPTVGLVFAPLGGLPRSTAGFAWTVASVGLVVLSIALILTGCPRLRRDPLTIACFVAAWPALQSLVLYGQASAVWLFACAVAWCAIQRGRLIAAGAALGLLALKPTFLPFVVLVLVGARRWRELAGFVAVAAGGVLVSLPFVGWTAWRDYAAQVPTIVRAPALLEPSLAQAHGLLNAAVLLLGRTGIATALFIALATPVAWITIRAWRAPGRPGPLAFALLMCGAVLVNPHVYVYDLVVLAAAFLPVLDRAELELQSDPAIATRVRALVAACVLAPLAGPLLAPVIHLQLSVVAMLALVWMLGRLDPLGAPAAAG